MEAEKIRERLRTDPDLRDRVAWRAFEIFASRGYQGGRDLDDWLQAEDQVVQEVLDETEQPTVILKASALDQSLAESGFKEEPPSVQEASPAPVVESAVEPAVELAPEKSEAVENGSPAVAKTATPKETKKRAASTKKASGSRANKKAKETTAK